MNGFEIYRGSSWIDGARDATTASIHHLANRLAFQHSDGSLELTGGMWQP